MKHLPISQSEPSGGRIRDFRSFCRVSSGTERKTMSGNPSIFKSAFLKKGAHLPEPDDPDYVVKRYGKALTESMTHNECFQWIYDHQVASVSHAIRHEGYSIDPASPSDVIGTKGLNLTPEDEEFMKSLGISEGLGRRPDYGHKEAFIITGGVWGTKSHEGDPVHDILDRYRSKGLESDLGFDEPVPPDQVNRLLDEIERYDVSMDSKEGGRGDYPGAQVYVGVVAFLVEHGSDVRPEVREKAAKLAEGLLANKGDLSSWKDPEARADSLKREVALLKAGPGLEEQNAVAKGNPTEDMTKSAATEEGEESESFMYGTRLSEAVQHIVGKAHEVGTPEAYRAAENKLMGIRTFLIFTGFDERANLLRLVNTANQLRRMAETKEGKTASAKTADSPTPWDFPMIDKPLMAYRKYRCLNCGNEQEIQTNHTGIVWAICKGCSWKGSTFRGPGRSLKDKGLGVHYWQTRKGYNGVWRPFEIAELPEVEERRKQEAAETLRLSDKDKDFLGSMGIKAAASPRAYPVQKKENGFWYVIGLPGEELSGQGEDAPMVKTPDSWLNVHQNAKNLDLAEQVYRELYAEFQTNDNLREGDIFDTPIGQFICQGVDVLPHDDLAKKRIAEVDDSYRCANCNCDQGHHKKTFDQNGFPVYGACPDHVSCKEYSRKG